MAAVAAALLIMLLVRMIAGAFNLSRSGEPGVPDPQFAESAVTVTRPPEMAGESGAPDTHDDPSAGWEAVEMTPVDKTALELAREEAAED